MKLDSWIGLAVCTSSVYIAWQVRQILLLIFAAIVLADGLARLIHLFQWLSIKKRGVAIALAIILLLASVAGFLVIITPPFVDQLEEIVHYSFPSVRNLVKITYTVSFQYCALE